MNIFDALAKPFPESSIHWRVGSTTKDKDKGIGLAYIDARDVMQRLDDVVGPENWQAEYPFPGCCRIGIRVSGKKETLEGESAGSDIYWAWKSNGADETDYEGVKGQYSDAFKRAAVLWGVGRYLYDLPNEWVPIQARGRSYVLSVTPKLPAWATPNGWNRIGRSIKQEVYKQMTEALANGDGPALKEIWDEWDNEEKIQLWPMFESKERSAIKALMKND